MTTILDASVLVKLVLEEPGSGAAREAVKSAAAEGPILTVDIAIAESLNAIWKHTTLVKDIGEEEAVSAARDLTELCSKIEVISTLDLWEDAINLALKLGVAVYDALYIAAARERDATLYTADVTLRERAEGVVGVEFTGIPR